MVRQLRGAGVRRDLARDLTRASSPLLVAPLGGVGPSESDGTGPAEGCCLWWSSVWTGDVLAGAWRLSRPQLGPGSSSLGPCILFAVVKSAGWARQTDLGPGPKRRPRRSRLVVAPLPFRTRRERARTVAWATSS